MNDPTRFFFLIVHIARAPRIEFKVTSKYVRVRVSRPFCGTIFRTTGICFIIISILVVAFIIKIN